MKNKSVKFRTILTLVLSAISTLAVAEITTQKFCAMVRDDHITQSYIESGLGMHDKLANFISKNPSKEAIQSAMDRYNKNIQDHYEEVLAKSYEIDNQLNKQFPQNNFPEFTRDQVILHKLVLVNAYENGGSIISNREWVYNHCMDAIKDLE